MKCLTVQRPEGQSFIVLIAVVCAIGCLSRPASAGPWGSSPKKQTRTSTTDNVLGAQFSTLGGPKAASTLAARFVRDHAYTGGGLAWIGYGGDLGVISRKFESFDATIAQGLFRAGFVGPGGGLELDGRAGLAIGNRTVGVGTVGINWTYYLFGVGVSVQYPLWARRPDWLATGQLTAFILLPIDRCSSPMSSCEPPPNRQRKQ